MSRKNFYLSLFFLLPLIYFLSLPNSVGDLAIWIAQGMYFLKTGQLLRHDIFSVLPTQDLIYPAATCVLYALVYSVGGLIAVSLLHKLVVLGLSWIWWNSSISRLQLPWSNSTIFTVLVCWFGASSLCIDRPALLATLPFLLSFLILQKKSDLQWMDIVALNGINIAWVNLHGSWLLLSAMYVWRELTRSWRHFTWREIAGLATLGLSSLVNPFGYRVFEYVVETTRVSRERGIDEWATTAFSGNYPSQSVAFYLVFLFFAGCLVFWWRKNREKAVLFLSSPVPVLLVAGIHSVRNTIWIFLALIPAAVQFGFLECESGNSKTPASSEKMRHPKAATIGNAVIVAALSLFLVAMLPIFKPKFFFLLPPGKRAIFDSSAPFAFSKVLDENHDQAPIFNDWEYGSFLALAQSHRIFIDTRNTIYGPREFHDYQRVVEADRDWAQILDTYRIGYIMLNKRRRSKLIQEIQASRNWGMLFEDENTVLFKRLPLG